jgi:hypothetical protein
MATRTTIAATITAKVNPETIMAKATTMVKVVVKVVRRVEVGSLETE